MADDKPDPCVVCHRTAAPTDSLCPDCRKEFANEDGLINLATWELIERVAKRAWAFALEQHDVLTSRRASHYHGYKPGDPGASRSTGRRRLRR